MEFRSAKDLETSIKGGAPLPVYLLWGEESRQIGRYCDMLCAAVPESELLRCDGRAISSVDDIADYALSLSFFGGRRGVMIDDLDTAALRADDFEKLLELLASPEQNTLLVISCRTSGFDPKKDSRAKKLLAACEKSGGVCAFPKLASGDAARLASALAARQECVLERAEASVLAEYCGADAVRIENEVDKLCAHSAGKRITREDIELLVAPNVEANVFRLSELLLRGDFGGAMRLVDDLIFLREEPAALISMLSMAVSDIFRAKAADISRIPSQQAAKAYGINQYRYDKAVASARRLDVAQARRMLDICAQAELSVKAQGALPRIALELAIAELTSVAGAAR